MNKCTETLLTSVKIQLRGLLSWIENQSEIEIEVICGTNVADVLIILANLYGKELKHVLLHADGTVYRGLAVSIDQKNIPYQQLTQIRITEPCILTLIPLTSGG